MGILTSLPPTFKTRISPLGLLPQIWPSLSSPNWDSGT